MHSAFQQISLNHILYVSVHVSRSSLFAKMLKFLKFISRVDDSFHIGKITRGISNRYQEGGEARDKSRVWYKRNRRGVISREGEEAVDHRQEIAIAGAGIPTAAL